MIQMCLRFIENAYRKGNDVSLISGSPRKQDPRPFFAFPTYNFGISEGRSAIL